MLFYVYIYIIFFLLSPTTAWRERNHLGAMTCRVVVHAVAEGTIPWEACVLCCGAYWAWYCCIG